MTGHLRVRSALIPAGRAAPATSTLFRFRLPGGKATSRTKHSLKTLHVLFVALSEKLLCTFLSPDSQASPLRHRNFADPFQGGNRLKAQESRQPSPPTMKLCALRVHRRSFPTRSCANCDLGCLEPTVMPLAARKHSALSRERPRGTSKVLRATTDW